METIVVIISDENGVFETFKCESRDEAEAAVLEFANRVMDYDAESYGDAVNYFELDGYTVELSYRCDKGETI